MNTLHTTVVSDFIRYYQQAAAKIHTLVEPLSDQQIWTRPYPYGNSVGHLLLHLTGNLSFYIGAEIGGTGYVRDRPLEFSDTARHPKAEVLKKFDAAISTVAAALQKQAESDWSKPYSAKGLETIGDRFYALLHLAGHLSHHTGQIMYLCKEMERKNET